jgi:hypothetical protein
MLIFYAKIEDDGLSLELHDKETVKDITFANLHGIPAATTTLGHTSSSVGKVDRNPFPAHTKLRWVSHIGDVLLGSSWDHPQVHDKLLRLFSPNADVVEQYVLEVHGRIKQNLKDCMDYMRQYEIQLFGVQSYFAKKYAVREPPAPSQPSSTPDFQKRPS